MTDVALSDAQDKRPTRAAAEGHEDDASCRVEAISPTTVGETVIITTVEEHPGREGWGGVQVTTVGERVTTVGEHQVSGGCDAAGVDTVGESGMETTVGEHQVSEGLVDAAASVRISAATVESISETIAASASAHVDVDDSVAATLASSVDRESLETDDRAGEESEAAKYSVAVYAMDESTEMQEDDGSEQVVEAKRLLEHEGAESATTTTTATAELIAVVDEQTADVTCEKESAQENEITKHEAAGDLDSARPVCAGADDTTLIGIETEACKQASVPSADVTEADEPIQSSVRSKKTSPTRLSSMISRLASKVTTKKEVQCADPAVELELNASLPVESIVHEFEAHEPVLPQTHRTLSAAQLDASGSLPVKNVVHRLEAHDEEENALESLKIRTKRDFFSEKGRSISVSHEAEKYNSQMVQRAKEEVEAKDPLKSPAMKQSPASRKSSAMSSVRNMASRFEKKADQSLDKLSFRTVRSFFPTEKSIHVGAEKQKYEALEKEKQTAKKAEETGVKRMATDEVHKSRKQSPNEIATDEHLAAEAAGQGTPVTVDTSSSPTEPDKTAVSRAGPTPEAHSRRRTITAADSSGVRGIAHRFETKRANSVVTAPVRTIDTFIVADSEASVRVSAEKARYENQVKTSAPTKRTIDTFIVPTSEASVRVSAEKAKLETLEKPVKAIKRTIDAFIVPESEASVCVSAEKAKYEMPGKQIKATVRTIDNFIVPENEASVRVSAEKAKLEAPDKLVKAAGVRTIDTYIVPESDASVHVSAEKAKFESMEQRMQAASPAVRTIDTFIVPESEVSIRVATEKAKLEAIEKQKKSELETQAVIEKQKLMRVTSWALERAESKKASHSADIEAVGDSTVVHQTKETEAAKEMEMESEADERKDIEATKVTKEGAEGVVDVDESESAKELVSKDSSLDSEDEATRGAEVTSPIEVVSDTEVSSWTDVAAESEMMKKGGEQLSVAEDTEVAVIEKMDDTDLIKEIGVASDTNDAENVASDAEVTGADEKAEEASKVEEAKMGDVETAEIGETKAEEAEEAAKMEEMTEGTDLLEVATKVEETEITDVDEETAVRVELEAPEAAKVEAAADIDVALKTEVKQAEAKETEVKQTESKKTVVTEEVVRKTDVTEVTESTDHTEEAAAVFETVSKDEVEQTEVVTDRKTETETVEISEAFDTTEEAEKGTTSSSVKEVEVALTFINEARATAEPDDVVHLNEDDGCAQVGEEVEEMVTSAKEEESEEVATNEVGETAEADKVIQEATIEEVQQVRFTRDSAVQVVVERQTFGDMLSTAQHAHWLSLPVSANPALARLHSVLSDHDLLTAYALYPSNSSSSSGSDEDESLPHIPTSKPFAAT